MVECFEEGCVGFDLLPRLVVVSVLFFKIEIHAGFLGLEVIVHDVSRFSVCWHIVHVHFFFFICEVVVR